MGAGGRDGVRRGSARRDRTRSYCEVELANVKDK